MWCMCNNNLDIRIPWKHLISGPLGGNIKTLINLIITRPQPTLKAPLPKLINWQLEFNHKFEPNYVLWASSLYCRLLSQCKNIVKAKLQTEQEQENKEFELQVPLGKKSLPTRFSRTELLPLLCKKKNWLMLTIQTESSLQKSKHKSPTAEWFLWLCCHKQNNETFDLISSFRYFDLMSSCHLYICLITQKNMYKSICTVVFSLEESDLDKTNIYMLKNAHKNQLPVVYQNKAINK